MQKHRIQARTKPEQYSAARATRTKAGKQGQGPRAILNCILQQQRLREISERKFLSSAPRGPL